MRLAGWGLFAVVAANSGSAQLSLQPTIIESGREIVGSAPVAGQAGEIIGCFAIATTAGSPLTVSVSPAGFDGEVGLATGPECQSAVVTERRAWTGPSAISFTAPATGTRHLVIVRRSAGPGGTYRLTAKVAPPGAVTASGFAAPSRDAQSAQRQIMLEQIARGEVRTVGADDLRRQAEAAERRAQEEQYSAPAPAPQVDVVGSFLQGFNEGTARAAESARQVEAQNREIRAMAAAEEARQARERARMAEAHARDQQARTQAQQQAAAAQQRLDEARRQQQAAATSPAQSPSTTGRSQSAAPSPGQAELYYFPESLVYCSDIGTIGVDCLWEGNGELISRNDTRFASDEDFLRSIQSYCAGIGAGLGTNGQGQTERLYRCNVGGSSFSPFAAEAMRNLRYFNIRRVFRCPASVRVCRSGG